MTALSRPSLIPHIIRQRTEDGPMRSLQLLAREAEKIPGVLRVDIASGFAYSDVPRMGMGILVTTDGDGELAAEIAESLAAEAFAMRVAFTADLPAPQQAVTEAIGLAGKELAAGPVILSDLADNVGGGSPGDGTELLSELLRQNATGAIVMLADPDAVAVSIRSGTGSEIQLLVGGKSDDQHGPPVSVSGRVVRISDGVYTNRGPMRDGLVDRMGTTVVLDCGGIALVLTSHAIPMWNLEQLRSLGVEPSQARLIVCKGAVAHRAAYGPIASRIIDVETRGACAGDIRLFNYRNIRRPIWPLDRW